MTLFEPKIHFEGLYHLVRMWKVSDVPTEYSYARRCDDHFSFEENQLCYWPNVTCLECLAVEWAREARAAEASLFQFKR